MDMFKKKRKKEKGDVQIIFNYFFFLKGKKNAPAQNESRLKEIQFY